MAKDSNQENIWKAAAGGASPFNGITINWKKQRKVGQTLDQELEGLA